MVRRERERFSLKANLYDSLWMIIPDESFLQRKKVNRGKIAFPQKCLKFHFRSYLNDDPMIVQEVKHISWKLFLEVCENIIYAKYFTIFYES